MTDTMNATGASRSRSARTVAVDNFLRKTLRVGDPRNPDEVAKALLDRYPGEADRARREREGVAYSSLPQLTPATLLAGVAATAELAQAQDDLERDALALVTSSQLKDIRVELTGWGRAIRRIADDGLAAARLALDAVQFDRALAARSQLGSYARLARYVGTLSDGAAGVFRRLAQSCDSLAGLILVAMGEGLASAGITRGTSMVRVAASELQSRRNAVVNALRNLAGSTEASMGQQEWPRGLEAYRRLIRRLDTGGQADLRALLEENSLAAAMDELVDLSAGGNISGLRELSTASALLLARFQRLIQYSQSIPIDDDDDLTENDSPESPPLAAFSSALQLFVDAFAGSGGGSRLLYVARPPIVIYGLYGAAGPDAGANRLMRLTMARGTLAEQIDCLAGCECDEGSLRCQILADFLLFLVDRAIDAYAVGTEATADGDPEKRAAAYGHVIETALSMVNVGGAQTGTCEFDAPLRAALLDVAVELIDEFDQGTVPFDASVLEYVVPELKMLFYGEGQIERLVRSLSTSCHTGALFDGVTTDVKGESYNRAVIRESLRLLGAKTDLVEGVSMPPTLEASLATLASDRSERKNPS